MAFVAGFYDAAGDSQVVCRIGKASVAASELAFWPGIDDSVWADGRGGMVVWQAAASRWRNMALTLFGWQLAVAVLWSPTFSGLPLVAAAFAIILLLLLLLLLFSAGARRVDRLAAALFVPYVLWVSLAAALNYTIWTMNPVYASERTTLPTAYALRLKEPLTGEGLPAAVSWEKAPAYSFDQDWKGENPDPERATEVRVLWTPETFFLRFHCKYRNIYVFPDARADGWRYELWERDVAETFLQPDSQRSVRLQGIRSEPEWILDRSGGLSRQDRGIEERFAAPRA